MAEPISEGQYIGVALPGGYRTNRLIGKGTFAWVYHGWSPRAEPIAIKILHRTEEQARKRFQREVIVTQALPASPHVVGYRGHGETAFGQPFLALEFVDGYTLAQLLATGRRLDEGQACDLMTQLCDAFAGLHKLGLAHRDIKPENIMLTHAAGTVKLMDFGLVRDAQGLLKLFEENDILAGRNFADNIDQGMVAGTPEYMAPEQIEDPILKDPEAFRTDTPADVYSLGIIFYQLLSGRKPFPLRLTAQSEREYRRQIMTYMKWRMAQPDDALRPIEDIAPPLWDVVAKALRRDPKKRQGDAIALRDDIVRYRQYGLGMPDDVDESETTALDVEQVRALEKLYRSQQKPPEEARRRPVIVMPRTNPPGPPAARDLRPAPPPEGVPERSHTPPRGMVSAFHAAPAAPAAPAQPQGYPPVPAAAARSEPESFAVQPRVVVAPRRQAESAPELESPRSFLWPVVIMSTVLVVLAAVALLLLLGLL